MSRGRINGYSKQYIIKLIEQDRINAIFNTSDILYCIMLQCDIKVINRLRLVNKHFF